MVVLAVVLACSADPVPPMDPPDTFEGTVTGVAPPLTAPSQPTGTPGSRARPVLLEHTDASDPCGGAEGCSNLADVAVMWQGADMVRVLDVTGDGVDDLVTQSAAFPVPEAGGFPLPATAWWETHAGGGHVQPADDLDGDGSPDLAWQAPFETGWYLGPFDGYVGGEMDVLGSIWWLDDFTGDGILDRWERAWDGSGTIEIFAGPHAHEATEPWLRVEYAVDRADPDQGICFSGYGFFDTENTFSLYVGDVLGGPEAELQIRSDYEACPLARPLFVSEGGGYVVSEHDTGGLPTGPLMFSTPDIDGDGVRDTLALDDAGYLHRGRPVVEGDALVLGPAFAPEAAPAWSVLVEDVTGDGLADAVELVGSSLVVLAGDGAGGFAVEVARIESADPAWYHPVDGYEEWLLRPAMPAGHGGWWYAFTEDATGLFRLEDLL